jgi:hypothetical protein
MRFLYVVLLSACALMWTATLLAQSPNGVINGLVVDPSNKVIAAADILVINDATGVKYSGKTNADGIYVVSNLPPGSYRLQVSKIGFKTLIKPDIVLNIQNALSINFALPLGAIFETLTVESGASMINTTDAAVSTVIDNTYVENMPLNGRSFQDLILLTPGVATQTPQQLAYGGLGESGEFSVNGQRTEENYYTVDGVSANVGAVAAQGYIAGAGLSGGVAASTALGTTQALVSVDDLQEFRVLSSTYSAEYGRTPGGQFAFETKSGTNQWHGTAYDYLRNGVFDAQDWFDGYFGIREPALRQDDFGGTLGGPFEIPGLYSGKDKTFVFISYEGLRLNQPQPVTIDYVPDTSLRASAPAVVQQALNAYPVPNGPDVGNGIAEFTGSWSNPASLDSTSVRLDHVVNDKLRLFFRFSDTGSSSKYGGWNPSTSAYAMRTYTAGASSFFTPRISNELRLNYSSNRTMSSQTIGAFGGSTPVNLALLSGLRPGSWPAFELNYGGYNIGLVQQQPSGAQIQWNLVDAVGLSLGRHQFKLGVDYRRLTPSANVSTPFVFYDFYGESTVTSNNPLEIIQSFGSAYPLYTNFSAFAQDDLRVSKRLSMSFGLRWEVNPAPGVTQGLKPYTVIGPSPSTWALAPQGTPLWQTTWFNLAPRLGAAYVLRNVSGWETVVRAGGGVFFDTGQQLGSQGFLGAGFIATNVVSAPFPVAVTQIPQIVNPPAAPYAGTPVGFAAHLQLPYTLQWNVSLEQALGKSQTLSVSYVGSRGSRLLQQRLFNVTDNPNSNYFELFTNGLTSDYDSLQIQFRRRLSRGLSVLASYTWSHCIDYGSSNFLFSFRRGSCDFDVRQNLSTAFSYDLPNMGRTAFATAVLHHWGLDDRLTVRSAFPVSLYGSELLQPNGQFFWGGLNFVQNQPIYLYGANCASVLQSLGDLQPEQRCPGGRAINPSAFTVAGSGLGDVPRNFLNSFGEWQTDLAVRRDFSVYDRIKMQFRAEAFNVLNHPNFGNVNRNFGQTTFGQATGTLASTLGILSPLYQTGGPRSMQFALRVSF